MRCEHEWDMRKEKPKFFNQVTPYRLECRKCGKTKLRGPALEERLENKTTKAAMEDCTTKEWDAWCKKATMDRWLSADVRYTVE